MAKIMYKNVGISAISACVPKNTSSNYDLHGLMPEEEIEKMVNSIGIKEKRFVDDNVCASDLCFKAAEKLFADNEIDRKSIDLLLFLSQTPDYKIPATSPSLQHRLGLPKSTACMDLSLGCSGYIYGLSTAFAYASIDGINRVLLLVGDTFSKIVNPKDKVNAPLYGDAGTATLIEKENNSSSYFLLNSDGKGEDAVKIPSGGYRFPVKAEDLTETVREEGNIRSNLEIYMNGMDVFNFAIHPRKSNGDDGCWRWGKQRVQERIDQICARPVSGKESWKVSYKDFLDDPLGEERRDKPKSIWMGKEFSTDSATKQLNELLPGVNAKQIAPKPIGTIKRIVEMSMNPNDIMIDFFSGSATSAHAVMTHNTEDCGNRKFVMVQLPEACDEKSEAFKAGYKTIAEIGKDRKSRRVGKECRSRWSPYH